MLNSLLIVVSLIAVWPFGSAQEYHMKASNSVPAATGTVKAQKDKDNGNTKLDIKVEHLAEPTSLTPPAKAYLVWVRPHGETAAVKQGALKVDNDLKGELKVVTVSKDFDVLVTAEQDETASTPSDRTVLDTFVTMH